MTVFRRRPGIASAAVLAAITAALAAAQALTPGWTRSAGLDVWNIVAEEDRYQSLMDQRDELEAHQGRMFHQMAAGEQLARRLVAGRASLAEAADEVIRVNRDRPGFFNGLRADHRGARNDREVAARYAIAKVQQLLNGDPTRRSRETARLEAEFRAMTGQR